MAVDAKVAHSQPDYIPAVGDVVKNRRLEWEGTVISIKKGRIEIFGKSCSSWYNPKDFDVVKLAQPLFTGTYAEKQKQWIAHHRLKVGDKVKVVRKYEEEEDGCVCSGWDCGHTEHVNDGKVGEITDIEDRYIDVDGWTSPYFALEPVAK